MTPDPLIDAANAALERGEIPAAVDRLEQAARAQVERRAPKLATHGFRLAAVLAMTIGDPARAVGLAGEAIAAAPEGRDRFAAFVASAEANRQADRAEAALADLAASLELAAAGDKIAVPSERAALLRRRAGIQHARGRTDAALADLRRAGDLLTAAGEHDQAAVTELELAGIVGDERTARLALDAARAHASAAGSAAALAQVDAAAGAAAFAAGDAATARGLFESARTRALDALDPATYIAAVAGLAAALEHDDDHVGAYGALASGWVTVGGLLGQEVGAEAFRPQLLALRSRWGDEQFARVKAAHDEQRRRGVRT